MTSSIFLELLRCARDAGIEVRHVALGGSGGGLATVKGERKLFIDTDADPEDQLERTVAALARVEGILDRPIREDVRELLRRTS